jgi:putative nucleotidyltransferase with HDIG domain
MQRRKLRQALKKRLSPKRYQHVLRVARVATRIARLLKADENKAYLAALLHDIERELPQAELTHGHLGATYARKKFDITDQDILNAIRYHTLGRKKMSQLEKIIFVADYCEPGRTFQSAHKLRKNFYRTKNLEQAVKQKQLNMLEYRRKNPKELR